MPKPPSNADLDEPSRSEWDFSEVPEEELFPCMAYELLRESASTRLQASLALANYRKLARQHGHDPSEVALPTWEEFREHHVASSFLTLIAMANAGFPRVAWQDLKDSRFRLSVCERLDIWRRLPKARKSAGKVTTAVQNIGITQYDEAIVDDLRSLGVEIDAILCQSTHPVPDNTIALFINPNVEDKVILEGVAAYLSVLRKSMKPAIEEGKPAPGGRAPNTTQPKVVLAAIGLTRLAHHLPGTRAWKLFHPHRTPKDVGVEIKRARALCLAAMHAHFDLPTDEKPMHLGRKA